MSRARDWTHPVTGVVHWFDSYDAEATVGQLELVADMEDIEIDDLLEERLSTRAVLYRLNVAVDAIPSSVVEVKRKRASLHVEAVCRICPYYGWNCEGRITRHHFVPRWLMLELENYVRYSPRAFCTIPICVGRHRDLHRRSGGFHLANKSIVPYLTESEKHLAGHLIESLKDERPRLYDLIAGGDQNSYEYTLLRDWQLSQFHTRLSPARS
jgi:hypothetical protein